MGSLSVCVCVCVPGFLVARHKVGLKCCHSVMAAVPARHDFGLSPSQQRQKCLPGRSVRGAKDKIRRRLGGIFKV